MHLSIKMFFTVDHKIINTNINTPEYLINFRKPGRPIIFVDFYTIMNKPYFNKQESFPFPNYSKVFQEIINYINIKRASP